LKCNLRSKTFIVQATGLFVSGEEKKFIASTPELLLSLVFFFDRGVIVLVLVGVERHETEKELKNARGHPQSGKRSVHLFIFGNEIKGRSKEREIFYLKKTMT
jgi:hypothetical protein